MKFQIFYSLNLLRKIMQLKIKKVEKLKMILILKMKIRKMKILMEKMVI